MSRRLVTFASIVAALSPAVARAESLSAPGWGHRTTSPLPNEIDANKVTSGGDGVYGRFDGLFDVGIEAGASFDASAPSGAALASLHYMFMAGAYVGYEDSFGGASADSRRTLSVGVDVRPAFIPRWSNDLQAGNSFTDLVIDSISVGMGAYFRAPPGGSLGDRRGLELLVGVGVPLLGVVEGPWLGARGYLRWDDPGGRDAPAAEAVGLATLGWHFMVGGG
ncbi:MAG TPA: hypothetical protein VH062_37520 [Polyangiaceae bacterium]|jgi:hypothetical protein|nr:hypothetical protein [Polyangiaceae bacterium]